MSRHHWTLDQREKLFAFVDEYGPAWALCREKIFPSLTIPQIKFKYYTDQRKNRDETIKKNISYLTERNMKSDCLDSEIVDLMIKIQQLNK
uniref:Myb-like DNA-binding domain-containing protein n=1 Tax=Spironucleus salmonicida TaxID=348837 RepID=V6M0N7_9EUKA|eukprot:EST46679.1 Hypothetical protein SS50377_13310 [Spironucleus salmonicida]